MQRSDSIKLWYGVYGKEYEGNEPAFFDADDFDWTKLLSSKYQTIYDELAPLMHETNNDLKPYFDSDIQYPSRNWKTIGFHFWGKKNRKTIQRFPQTNAILQQIPGLVSASFNMLEPYSYINPHFGDTNAVYRAHLGIQIPEGLPNCGFRVKGENRAWQNGGILVFLDANVHEAYNHTSERRYILLLDVIRPEFCNRQNEVCAHVLAMLSLYYTMSLSAFWRRMVRTFSPFMIDVLLLPFRLLWMVYIRLF